MSIQIIKHGIADSIQDTGRYGLQYLGINPSGAMDKMAAQIANLLVGNQLNDALIELHFPASSFLFEEETIIALSGADFEATINDSPIPLNTCIVVAEGALLTFKNRVSGARVYLAVLDGLSIMKWNNSYSTNLMATVGGYEGRYLRKNDRIGIRFTKNYSSLLQGRDFLPLSWKINVASFYSPDTFIRVIEGHEFNWLTDESKQLLQSGYFTISMQSNRMGYRMKGQPFQFFNIQQVISTGLTKGTIQVLPDGQIIILMTDHQTTGGYPRIAHVISADIPTLAQMNPEDDIYFQMITLQEAENIYYRQQLQLIQLQNDCKLRLTNYLTKHGLY
jgi:antagonist of KipI